MNSLVSHHYWGSPGGGQLVCASASLALDELGLRPVLAGTFKFDPSRYLEWYCIDLRKYETVTFPFSARAFGLWSRLFVWYPALKAVRKFNPDLVFTDEVAYKPLLKHKTFRLVEYIHFPYEVAIDLRFRGTGLAYGEDPYITERYGRFPLSLYWKAYTWLLPRYMRDSPFRAADVVLANSRWTASVAKMVYGEEPGVLNPPLPPNVKLVERPRPLRGEGACRRHAGPLLAGEAVPLGGGGGGSPPGEGDARGPPGDIRRGGYAYAPGVLPPGVEAG